MWMTKHCLKEREPRLNQDIRVQREVCIAIINCGIITLLLYFIFKFLQLKMTQTIKDTNKGWNQTLDILQTKQCIKLMIYSKCHNVFGKNYTGKLMKIEKFLLKIVIIIFIN